MQGICPKLKQREIVPLEMDQVVVIVIVVVVLMDGMVLWLVHGSSCSP